MIDQKAQYEELGRSLRHNGDRRDARLTLYFAVAGGLVALLLGAVGDSKQVVDSVRGALKGLGAVVSVFFVFIEWRLWGERAHYVNALRDVEKSLHFDIYTRESGSSRWDRWSRWLRSWPLSLLLYIVFTLGWLWFFFAK